MNVQQRKAKRWVKKITAKNLKTTQPIPPETYLHKTDKDALAVLQKIPFFDTLCAKFIEVINERIFNIENMSSRIRITDKQCPRIYFMVQSICKKLGIEMPELYLELNRVPNAYTYGNKRIFITVTSGLLELLNDDEIYAVLAHECGHIACNHVLYTTMAATILNGGELGLSFLDSGLIAKLITTPLKIAFFNWQRCGEFSADRAAILCCESTKPVISTMMRLAGGTKQLDKELRADLFIEQAGNYQDLIDNSKMNKLTEFLMIYKNTHPLLSVRARAIQEWGETEECTILYK